MASNDAEPITSVEPEHVVFATQIDDNGRTVGFEFGDETSHTLRQILLAGLASDQALGHSNRDRRDKVRALSNGLGYALGEIDTESPSTQADNTQDAGILKAEWPYEYVEPGEVERNLSYQKAKELRQELEELRATVDEWSCDHCNERASVAIKNGKQICRVCAGFEDPEPTAETEPNTGAGVDR